MNSNKCPKLTDIVPLESTKYKRTQRNLSLQRSRMKSPLQKKKNYLQEKPIF